MLKRFDLDTLSRGIVAVGVLFLAYQVLDVALQDPALRSQVMILLPAMLAAVVYYFFPRKNAS